MTDESLRLEAWSRKKKKTKDIKIAEILTSFNKTQIKVVNYDSMGN